VSSNVQERINPGSARAEHVAGRQVAKSVEKGEVDLAALFDLSYGLYIVSSHDGDKANGLISNTAVQVTADPPRIAVTVNKESLTHRYISKSGVFAVSVLEEPTPMTFIGLFGFRSGRDVEKLSQVEYMLGETGCPLVTEHALTVIEAAVISETDVMTHTMFVGDIVACRSLRRGRPLTYAYYRDELRGKTPKNAPSYKPEADTEQKQPTERSQQMKKYICTVCGYVYDPAVGDPDNGIEAGTAFEDLPDDWLCPVCGAGKDDFEESD